MIKKAAILLLLSLTLLLGTPSSLFAGIRVELREEASLEGAFVKLGQIAEISGDDPAAVEQARNLFCGPVPSGNQLRPISRFYLKTRLIQSGFLLEEVQWSATRMIWVRARDEKNKGDLSEKSATPIEAPAARLQSERKQAIIKAARNYILTTLGARSEETIINFKAFHTNLTRLPEGDMRVVGIQEFGSRNLVGTVKFYVKVAVNSSPITKILVAMDVKPYGNLVVAARAVPTGQTLTAADLKMERVVRWGHAGGRKALTDLKGAVGKRAIRAMKAGDTLFEKNLVAVRLVEPGRVVRVIINGNGFRLETKATARSAGSAGETIEVENPITRKRFSATVIGENQVEIQK